MGRAAGRKHVTLRNIFIGLCFVTISKIVCVNEN